LWWGRRDKMISRLKELGISKILVADDRQENIQAARQYFETLKGISTCYFNNGKDAIKEIIEKYASIGLVLTDLEMETPEAGVDVALTGMDYIIPSYILTGGPQHRGSPTVRVIPGLYGFEGTKAEPETWKQCLESLVDPSSKAHALFASILRLRRTGTSTPFPSVRPLAELVVRGELRSLRHM